MDEYILKNFELHFPIDYAKIVSYKIVDELVYAELSDGYVVRYDDLDNSIRVVKRAGEDSTEKQVRIEFSQRLNNRLRRLGITQGELAEMTGLSEVIISRYMNHKASPSYMALIKISKALDCSIDDLTYRD